jgi:hypothetical protein
MPFFLLQITDKEFNEMPYDRTHMVLVEAGNESGACGWADIQFPSSDYPGIWDDKSRTTCTELVETKELRVVGSFAMGSG